MVVTRTSTNALVIPAAGSVQGSNGTFFRSDVIILNFRATAQTVRIDWLPQGGGAIATRSMSIPALSGLSSEDFVQSLLGQSGLGALLVTAVTENGALDPNGAIFMLSDDFPEMNEGRATSPEALGGTPVTLHLDLPDVKFATVAPNLTEVLPYVYASNAKHGTPLYKTVPSREQMLRYEPYLEKKDVPDGGAARPSPAAAVAAPAAPVGAAAAVAAAARALLAAARPGC